MARFYPTGGTGGANVSVVTALAEDVAKGKVIVGQDGKPITGTLELTGTAADSQVLAGQTYYNTDLKAKRTGAMTNRGAWNSSGLAAGAAVTVPAGYHNGGGKVTAKDLVSQTSGDATAAQIWTGKKAWVNGKQITGTLATQGGSTTTPGTAAKTIVTPNKIVTGSIIVAGDANLVPGNIKKNVSIFGVKGTFEGYVADTTDLFDNGNNAAGFSLNRDGQITGGAIYYPKKYNNYVFAILTGSKSYPFANYNSLNIDFYITDQSGNSKENLIQLYNGSTTVAAYNYTSGYYPAGRRTVTINISAVGGSFVPVIRIDSSFTWSGAMYIYKIWLS